MISQKAIDDYLSRQLASFAWLKKVPRNDLIAELKETISDGIDIDTLWTNQLVMLLIGTYCPNFLYLADMGTGKTRVILELVKYRKSIGEHNTWLICALNKVNIKNWAQEIDKFAPELRCISLEHPDYREMYLQQEADIFLIHYTGLMTWCAGLERINRRSKKRKREIIPSRIQFMRDKFTGIVLDEISEIGRPRSITSRVLYQIAKDQDYRYGLTGTPFGRDPMPLWNQFHMIDDGDTLGKYQGLFRGVFFKEVQTRWAIEYRFIKAMQNKLHRTIANRSITYTEGECQDLPEKVSIKRATVIPDSMEAYYQAELKLLRQGKGNFQAIKASFLRMRQLASGFLGLKNDETGERAEIEFPINPKLDELMEMVLKELPGDAKMIVFHEFIWTGKRISLELKEHNINHARLYGGQKDQGSDLIKFQDDPKCRLLIANSKVASMGLNLQAAKYVVFFESPLRPIIRQQAERRARRAGQESDRVFIVDLIAKTALGHSIDERILALLAEGKNLLKAILQGKEEL